MQRPPHYFFFLSAEHTKLAEGRGREGNGIGNGGRDGLGIRIGILGEKERSCFF